MRYIRFVKLSKNIFLVIAGLMFICFSGCTITHNIKSMVGMIEPNVNQFITEELFRGEINKVLIVPFVYDDGPEKIKNDVTNAFATELGNSGLFNVISPSVGPKEIIDAGKTLWEHGTIDVDTLIEARKSYGVDGFVFGKVTQYKAYVPLTLGLKVMMISGLSGGIIWSSEGVFDSDHKDVVQAGKSYYKKNYRKDQSLYGWELMFISMERYTKFINNLIVKNLVSAKPKK